MLFSSVAEGIGRPRLEGELFDEAGFRPARERILLDEAGQMARTRQMVWIMSLGRFLALGEILLMAWLSPDWIGGRGGAMLVFFVTLAYTLFYVTVSIRTRASGTWTMHGVDIAAGVLLLLLAARMSAILFPMAFYTSWISWDRMSWRFRDVLPATVILSLAFLLAESVSTLSHDPSSEIQAVFAFYYMRGIYSVGFSWVMYRVSALELDSHLENQRLQLRRRLHDDLGNTLCGLHYNIECLRIPDAERVRGTLKFLERGYARATGTLGRILKGLDEPDVDIAQALEGIRKDLAARGWTVSLDVSKLNMDVSPEVIREIIGILKEAAMNAVKHSGGSHLDIHVRSRRHRVVFSVSDDGSGFEKETLVRRQKEGGKGILGMLERADLLNGKLRLETAPGRGTTIMLTAQESKRKGVIARILNIGEGNQGGFYNTLVRAKQLGTIIQLARTALLPLAVVTDTAMIAITAAVVLDTLFWTFFRMKIWRTLRRWPWLLATQGVFYSVLFYLTWVHNLPLMIVDATNLFMVIAAYFLLTRRAFTLSLLLALGIIAGSLLAPPLAGMQGQRNELIVLNIMSNVFFAVAVGFFVKFINRLEGMQKEAVSRTLTRQREQFSAETHRQIHSSIEQLEQEVAGMKDAIAAPGAALPGESVRRLKQLSNETKQRLRRILNFLDEPPLEAATLPARNDRA